LENVKNFVARWTGRGDEKSDTQTFWIDLLTNVFEVKDIANFIFFEERVQLEHKSFIDATIPATHVMIEQKSLGKDLSKPIKQSDGTFLTPFQQARRYANELPYSKRPRWIVACNFSEFHVYDMEKPHDEPEIIFLKNLPKEFNRLKFLVDSREYNLQRELEISLQAGEIVGKIYLALKKNYLKPDSEETLQSLNKLCVRLVFCFYAESAGIFGKHKIFRDYLQNSRNIRRDLLDLFETLNTEKNLRDPYLSDELKIFPFVNGGLFAEKNIEIPNFDDETKKILFDEAENFDWSGISPTIFGAVFESTLNPVTRREGGMHYTSIENIHKVINPLFLDDLHEEFQKIKSSTRNKNKNLLDFQKKLSELKFFDPACGSGNFLTESYISLRRLENEILKELLHEKILLGDFDNPVKISINQFFGVEINDFAVSVAQTALWIAELQMLNETQEIIHKNLNPLPLKNFANIFEGNALTLDWKKICPNPNFIFGNPPFVGASMMTKQQKIDAVNIFGNIKLSNSIDYVGAWYHKAAEFLCRQKLNQNNFCVDKNKSETISVIQKFDKNNFCDTKIKCAFVSTNSITQGEQVAALWDKILQSCQIIFAHRTFRWDSESNEKAHVHCVIIGFADKNLPHEKFIFDGDKKISAKNINPYLIDAPNILIQSRSKPLCDVPKLITGNAPIDGGNLILSEDEKNILIKKFPDAEKFIKILLGGEEFLHNKKRFCLWLVNANPSEIKKIPPIFDRVKKVREFRLNSKRISTKKFAETPQLFAEIRPTIKNFIAIPQVSSEKREYIPIGFLDENIIPTNQLKIIPNANLFHFGILSSKVHMIWTKTVCGRLKSDFRYSGSVVYNNFVWCEPTENLRKKIEQTAQNILDVRKKYPDASLADLYDPTLMPKDLRDAHKKNDLAVMEAYGFDKNFSDEEILAELMTLYKNFVEK